MYMESDAVLSCREPEGGDYPVEVGFLRGSFPHDGLCRGVVDVEVHGAALEVMSTCVEAPVGGDELVGIDLRSSRGKSMTKPGRCSCGGPGLTLRLHGVEGVSEVSFSFGIGVEEERRLLLWMV